MPVMVGEDTAFGALTLGIVELDVPIEVVAPALGRVAEADRDADGRRRFWALGHPQQVHAGFSRRPPTFLSVARHAAADDVLPVLPAALGDRQHMIEGQLARRVAVAAILAAMVIARVDVGARERDVIEPPLDLDVPKEPDDRREPEADRDCPELP